MPRKKRASKVNQLDDWRLHELQYGPGESLINGVGYFHTPEGTTYQLWSNIPDVEQSAIVERMRGDWQRHSSRVMAAWNARSESELAMAKNHYGEPAEPWAMGKFGTTP